VITKEKIPKMKARTMKLSAIEKYFEINIVRKGPPIKPIL
jgi:hypothetical protein